MHAGALLQLGIEEGSTDRLAGVGVVAWEDPAPSSGDVPGPVNVCLERREAGLDERHPLHDEAAHCVRHDLPHVAQLQRYRLPRVLSLAG